MSLRLKRMMITTLTAFVLLFVSLAIYFAPDKPVTVNAEVITAQMEGIDENYILNASETFPVSVEHSGKTFGDGVVIYPNGTAYKIVENKTFFLNKAGKYILRYFADSQVIEKTFVVSQKNFVLSTEEIAGKDDIVAATKEVMEGQSLPNGTNYPNNSAWPNIEQNLTTFGNEGLIVRMGGGTKFTYSEPIDLTKAGADGLTNVIKFQPRYADYDRTKAGSSGNYAIETIARNINITLTDCYDSTRYMNFIVLVGGDTNYARAGTDNLIDAGWVFPASKKATSDMAVREFYEGTEYGYAYIGSYGAGSPAGYVNEYANRDAMFFKYDYENARVYVTTNNTSGTGDYREKMITDFKNKSVYPGEFRGFTTGEVYLSIEFTDYQTPKPARVDIFQIGETTASELIEKRKIDESGDTTKLVVDTKDPIINVDFNPTVSDGVYVDVGSKFTLPKAEVFDINLKNSKVAVYRNYYDQTNRISIPVVDGKVLIDQTDTYYVVYTAEDAYSNTAEKVIKVFGVKDELVPAIDFDYGTKLANLKAGQIYSLPKFTFDTKNNASDRKVKITISSEKETFVLAELKNGQEIEEFLASDNEFFLDYAGEYMIEYVYSDNATSGVASYTLTSEPSDAISFPILPTLPKYLIKNATYDFDEIYAYNYSKGSKEPFAMADVYIAYDSAVNEQDVSASNFTKLTSVYSNKITGSEKAVLKYVYGENVVYSSVAKIVDINITQLNKLQQYKYFVGDFATGYKGSYSLLGGWKGDGDPTYDETLFPQDIYNKIVNSRNTFDTSKLDYKTSATSGDKSMEFINIIDYSNFSFTYRIIDDADTKVDADNFNAIRFVFTDPYNPENQAYIRIFKQGDGVFLDLNNQITRIVNQKFSGSIDKSVVYNLSTQVMRIGGVSEALPFMFNFTTTKTYFEVVLEDIYGVAGIRVLELNSHKFSHTGTARTLPSSLMTIPQGNYKSGTIIDIVPANFTDVLTPIIKEKVTLKVTDPNNNVVTALDGTLLDGTCDPYKAYQIKVTELGQYKVSYTAINGLNQKSNPPGFISVGDLTAPEITFEGDITENCVVYLRPNQALEIKYSVTDDVSLPENIFARIIWTNRKLSSAHLIDGNAISFRDEGEYIVGVSCADELGNFARKSFTVIVTTEEIK